MPHRDPETGKFVADGSSHMMADGGVPSGVLDHAYPGMGNYVDVETLNFNYQAIQGEGNTDTSFAGEILDFSSLLDRREEMADLLFAEISLVVQETGDSSLASNPQQAQVNGILHTNEGANSPIDLQQADFQTGSGLDDFIDTDDGADSISKVLTVGTYPSFEDATNGAGGSGGGQAVDTTRLRGWQLTDASFEERDELTAQVEMESSGDTSVLSTMAGRLVFALYELENPSVKPC